MRKFPHRRLILRALAATALAPALPARGAEEVRIGLTPVFLDDQAAFLARWRDWLSGRLRRPVAFVQRGSYREVVDLLRAGRIDLAWLCGFPYVRHRDELQLLALPLFHGRPVYQSYLIVPRKDQATRGLADLRGKVFAYSDPDSNSGWLYVQYALLEMGLRADDFFSRAFFTWAHRKVVEAVAVGLAQGGAVDGYVWETLARLHPDLTGRTRVAARSPEFAFPPFVTRRGVPAGMVAELRGVLDAMRSDPVGAELLERLNLDGFARGDDKAFDGIARMAAAVRSA